MRNWYNNTYTVIKERGEFMLTIYAVSDSIGETAEQVAQAAASQFDDEIEVKRVPSVSYTHLRRSRKLRCRSINKSWSWEFSISR